MLDYRGLSDIVRKCRHKGPLFASALTKEEIELVDKMLERVGKIWTKFCKNRIKIVNFFFENERICVIRLESLQSMLIERMFG